MRAIRTALARSTLVVGLAGLLASCAETTPIGVVFATDEMFLLTNTVSFFAVPVSDDNRHVCAQLNQEAAVNNVSGAVFTATNIDTCAMSNGTAPAFDEAPEGLHAWVAAGFDSRGVILTGCTVADHHVDAEAIHIPLFPTVNYPHGEVPNCTEAQKCGGGCL